MNDNKDISTAVADRGSVIVKTSIIGILTNVILAGFKAMVGMMTGSIAVVLDAVNNLSDAMSSVITIIGAKLGAKQPDKKHPLGYGRIEYLSSMTVAIIVIYAGATSLIESVKKIISPEEADYGMVSLVIISVAIVVKLVLGRYVKSQGEKVNSGALIASGSDASFDAVLSASVLASAVIYLALGLSLEAYVGVVIAGVIIKAGFEMLGETIADIIGRRGDPEKSIEIKRIINEEPEVRGAYDLTLFNYGPDKFYGSVHIELPDQYTVDKADEITRRIQLKVYQGTGVILTGIGIYSYNTTDDEAAKIRDAVRNCVLAHEWALQLHGFYLKPEEKIMRFDVVLSFDISQKEAYSIITDEIKNLYPDYELQLVLDIDVS